MFFESLQERRRKGKRGIKKPYISLSQLGGVWMVGVKGYIGLQIWMIALGKADQKERLPIYS